MSFNPVLDPEKDKAVNDWLSQTMAQRPGGDPAAAPAPAAAPPPSETSDGNDADAAKVETSHPGTQPDELDQYLKGQEAQSDKWGPDKEAAVMDHLQKGYKSPGFLLSEGAAGLGDAIMQGVARAGSGNFLNTVEKNKENNIKTAQEMGTRLDESNLKHMAAKERLEGMSSKTPLGASETPVLAAVLGKMGYPPDKIQGMLRNPAAARAGLQPMADVFTAQMKAQLEAELKKLEIGIQQQNMLANQALSKQARETDVRRTQQEADKAIAGGSSVPFIGPSHAQKQQALTRLSSTTFAPDVLAYAEKHGITPEQAQAQKDRRNGVK